MLITLRTVGLNTSCGHPYKIDSGAHQKMLKMKDTRILFSGLRSNTFSALKGTNAII